jgi:hypothetical protein
MDRFTPGHRVGYFQKMVKFPVFLIKENPGAFIQLRDWLQLVSD